MLSAPQFRVVDIFKISSLKQASLSRQTSTSYEHFIADCLIKPKFLLPTPFECRKYGKLQQRNRRSMEDWRATLVAAKVCDKNIANVRSENDRQIAIESSAQHIQHIQ